MVRQAPQNDLLRTSQIRPHGQAAEALDSAPVKKEGLHRGARVAVEDGLRKRVLELAANPCRSRGSGNYVRASAHRNLLLRRRLCCRGCGVIAPRCAHASVAGVRRLNHSASSQVVPRPRRSAVISASSASVRTDMAGLKSSAYSRTSCLRDPQLMIRILSLLSVKTTW